MVLELAGEAETALAEVAPGEAEGAVRRAIAHLNEACALAGGPHHPRWPKLMTCLAVATRITDRPGGRRHGLSGLRASSWQVLIQPSDELALRAARSAADTSRLVASWCVHDQAYSDLVSALDAGRGLTLHAAVASRSIPNRLADAGHHDLAVRWRAVGGPSGTASTSVVPEDLREQALHALTGNSEDPVSPEQIRRALGFVDADALVYLVASDQRQPGYATIVAAAGEVAVLPLPGLEAGHAPGSPTDNSRNLDVLANQDPAWRLDEVCRWAWTSAMGPLVEYTTGWRLQRPARLVLVPTGDLSLVPWHAAVNRGRYVLHDLVISYSMSARMFCASAQLPLRRPSSALIVGDPQNNLPHAAAEARAVHAAFHPDGTLLERATPDDVLDWIAAPDRGPSLLHLACHGHVDAARPVEAYVALHGGDLQTRRLLETA